MLMGLPPLNTINFSCYLGTSQGAFKEIPGDIRGIDGELKSHAVTGFKA